MEVGSSGGAEREQVWLRVCEALDDSLRGRGSVTLLTGPAGIGKTELMRAARSRAQGAGMQTLGATGRADERGFAFGVARQLLESRLAGDDRGPLLNRRATDDELGVEVLHRLYLACVELARKAPLALFVDDADHADEQSIAFLIHLSRRLDDLPVALVAAAGAPGGTDRRLELAELVSGCARGVRCELTPLSAPATTERVRLRWPDATDEACREIHERSGGNPVVVDALAGAQPGGDAAAAIARWALTQARDAHDHADLLLRAAAVLGADCRLRQAGALAGLDPAEAAVIADRLGEVGILSPGEPLRFAQPAVAEAIEAMLGPGERSAAHLRAARLLDADGGASDEVAAHLLETIPAGQGWVVDVLERAAAEAVDRGDPARAVRFLRRALDEPPSAGRRPQVVFALGHAEATSGEPQAAERLSSSAAEFATEPRQEPMAALSTGRALLALGQANEAIAVLEGALAEVGDDDGPAAHLLRADHMVARWLTRLQNGGATLNGDPPTGVDTPADRALLALHAIERAFRGTHCLEVRELAKGALGDGALLNDGTADGLTFYLAAAALAVSEDLAGAEAAVTAAVDEAEARGSVLGLATASAVRALTVLLAGRVADAARDARKGIAAERHGWRVALGDARVVLAHSLIETGDTGAAGRQLELGDAVVPDGHPARIPLLTARGRLQFVAGDAPAAHASLLQAGELAEKAGVHNPALAPWRSGAGLAAAALGDRAEGQRLIAEELSLAESFGAPGPIGRALRAQASTHTPRKALELLEAAVDTLDGSQAALERARALVDFGAALRRAGHRGEAREPLRAGLETAQRCGAEVLAQSAMRELTAAGARPRRVAQTGPEALTARERQVGALAAQGLSNREIAKTLVVTVKTVEWHLKHAYRKLGVESRGQLPSFFPAEDRGASGERS